jgi:hypothetical protein
MAPLVRDSAGIQIVESNSPAWPAGEGWSLSTEPAFVIPASDGRDETLPLDPMSIDVDSRGRIVVGDGNQVGWDAILVYDSLGRFLFRSGGEGQGPGEFGQLWWASAYRGDSLVGFDMSGDGLSIFSPDGVYVRGLRTPSLPRTPPPQGTFGYTAGADAAYGDGYFLAYPFGALDITGGPGPAWYRHLLLRLDPTGEAWDTLGSFEIGQQYWSGTVQEVLFFAPGAVSAVADSTLHFGRGESFEIGSYDRSGRLTRLMRWSGVRRPVTADTRDQHEAWYLGFAAGSPAATERAVERLARGQFADSLPAYSAILVDGTDHLWVEEFRWMVRTERPPRAEPTPWFVFTPEGGWLGTVEVPPGFILHAVTSNRALGLAVDEFGVKSIHAYDLMRSP